MKHHIPGRSSSYACAALLLLSAAQAAATERGDSWDAGVELSVLAEDNVTRTRSSQDMEKDTVTRVKVNARYALSSSRNRALLLGGHLLDENYRDFDGVSSVQAGLGLEYRFRTRAGFGAPVYSFFINHVQADFETDIRDGASLDYGLSLSRQYTDRIALAAGAGHNERTADGQVFDLEQTRYFLQLDYRVPNLFQTYLAYYYIDGGTYTISPVAPADYGYSYEAVEWDPAFSMIDRHWAYRLDARTDVLRLGFNIAINGNNTFDISVDDIGSRAAGPGAAPGSPGYGSGGGSALRYDTTIIAAGYIHRF